jgi:uncharacterized protein (TIGR00251 family)
MAAISQGRDGVRLAIRVQPRSSRSGVYGMYGESVRICLKSAPVDDAANQECCALLARLFGLAKYQVSVLAGHASRSKVVHVDGLSVAAVESFLAPYLQPEAPPSP